MRARFIYNDGEVEEREVPLVAIAKLLETPAIAVRADEQCRLPKNAPLPIRELNFSFFDANGVAVFFESDYLLPFPVLERQHA